MDFIRTKADNNSVPFSRPRSQDVFVNIPYINTGTDFCGPLGKFCQIGYATIGCLTIGLVNGALT